MDFEIEYYKDDRGNNPVDEFLQDLAIKKDSLPKDDKRNR